MVMMEVMAMCPEVHDVLEIRARLEVCQAQSLSGYATTRPVILKQEYLFWCLSCMQIYPKLAILYFIIGISSTVCWPQSAMVVRACSEKTWRNALDHAIPMTTEQLTRQAVRMVEPDSPILKTTGVNATIEVRIAVDKSGKVLCAKAIRQSNPLLTKISEQAASEWEFVPSAVGGKPQKITGNLVFKIVR
jgi:hypothetical protein